jgi:hypothetical protein
MLGSARATFLGAAAPAAVAAGRTALTVTAGDDAQLGTSEAKFGVSSGFMNANDYISATSDNFIFSGDFTIEFFGNLQGTNTGNMIRIGNVADTWASGVLRLRMSSGNVAVESYDGISITSTISSFDYTWRHWAIVRSGSTVTLYKDGVSQGTDTDSNTIGTTTYNQMVFGYGSWGSWAGYVDEIRVSNNARYTGNFTPTTSAFENDANTVILLHMDGTDGSTTFLDDAGSRGYIGLAANGNVQVDTAQSKYGGASALFDGSGDYITGGNHAVPATGEFTLEYWYRSATSATTRTMFAQYYGGAANEWTVWQSGSDYVNMYYQGAGGHILTSTTAIADNTWHHIAITRNSSNRFDLWIDRTSEDNHTTSGSLLERDIMMGARLNGGGPGTVEYVNGHMDEVRVSSIARYTTSFTPPTGAFTNDADTVFLFHADGSDGSTDFTDDNS